MRSSVRETIYQLWDTLADTAASKPEERLDMLMGGMCRALNTQSAFCLAARRVPENVRSTSTSTIWQLHYIRHFHPSKPNAIRCRERIQGVERECAGPLLKVLTYGAGKFRVHQISDVVPSTSTVECVSKILLDESPIVDSIIVGCPIDRNVECYYGFNRANNNQPFRRLERVIAQYTLRNMQWFHRQNMLNHGMLIAKVPPTPTERLVLNLMLRGHSEKQIAALLGQRPSTTHQHIKGLYRKFRVRSHPELMALWLGREAEVPGEQTKAG